MSWTSQAETLADTEELGGDVALMAGRCRATGLDPRAFAPIMGAAMALGARPSAIMDYAYSSDQELIEELLEHASAIYQRELDTIRLWSQAAAARQWAIASYTTAQALNPPDYEAMRRWRAVWADCDAALEVLTNIPRRLRAARTRLTMAPAELGDTYQAVYDTLAQDRVMPYDGRWLTGEVIP